MIEHRDIIRRIESRIDTLVDQDKVITHIYLGYDEYTEFKASKYFYAHLPDSLYELTYRNVPVSFVTKHHHFEIKHF